MRADNPWKILSSKIVYKTPWIEIQEDAVITPTGSQSTYSFLRSRDSVIIVALNERDEMYLIRTFAYPVATWNWELPGGGGDNEEPILAAKRELHEETGINAESWEKLGTTRVCNGLMIEHMHTYLARDLSFTDNAEISNEKIDSSKFVPMTEVDAMIERGDINDGQTITAVYHAQKWLTIHE